MERHRIPLRIILAALIFSAAVSLSGCLKPPPPPPPPPAASSYCNKNTTTKVYSCNINFTVTNLAGYSQTGGVSVIVANPQ
ncbi:MAG: hypothetical protein EVJ47_07560 [Candidatus Acidulodesulfobacterium ferriphilum]|uniref:Uncharacterized protein n=1 Tax=Candidatus Acidulodesulfobacterium ferriphilum TaxID=2597223 RepID=A0A519B9W0_9DELT|nr:MAG: hypothetical protein EVJ47_07560 [Candidatus Acidulodesulfobacterium ferriphilum]